MENGIFGSLVSVIKWDSYFKINQKAMGLLNYLLEDYGSSFQSHQERILQENLQGFFVNESIVWTDEPNDNILTFSIIYLC